MIGELVSKSNLGITVDATSVSAVAGELINLINDGISCSDGNLKRIAEENSLTSFLSTIDHAIR